MEKEVAGQAGNNHPTSIPTGVFVTSDGYINIATTGGRIWERYAQALGAPELVSNPDYATAPARPKNRDALNAEINKRTEKNSTDHLGQRTQRRRRALRSDLFDRPGIRGRPSSASRHRPGRAERRGPSHPPGGAAGHAVANPKHRGGAAAAVRRSRPTRCSPSSASVRKKSRLEASQGSVTRLKKSLEIQRFLPFISVIHD